MNDVLIARSVGGVHTVTGLQGQEHPGRVSGARVPSQRGSSRPGVLTRVAQALAPVPAGPSAVRGALEVVRRHATIACIIPAYNEEETIASVIESLLAQTRVPDVIHVIVNNTDDDTVRIASGYAGHHRRVVRDEVYETTVHVHDIGSNPDKKVGALNHGWGLARGHDYILGVDGDTTLDRRCVEWLELEMVDDSRIGGLSAVYSVDTEHAKGMAKLLVLGQRAQFAGFNMDNLLRGRNMAVLGGQCSLFSVRALEKVMLEHHQMSPWVRDSEVEDSLLSLQIKKAGFSTKISARARAFVGPMTTMRALHGQQVKWNYGAIDLMWPGQRGGTQGQPFHPNLRLRWRENAAMLFNIGTRLAFVLLLFASLSIGAFVFNPVWLIPPAVAILLNLRLAMSMHDRTWGDVLFAVLAWPAELYMVLRMSHFVTAWSNFFARIERDNWAAQAAAEKGRGGAGYIFPVLVAAAICAVLGFAWTQQGVQVQSIILSLGWPALYTVTVVQTLFMMRKLFRRQRGFRV